MSITKSFLKYIESNSEISRDLTIPSAILSDGGVLLIPLYAVTSMTLSETYHLPPLARPARGPSPPRTTIPSP